MSIQYKIVVPTHSLLVLQTGRLQVYPEAQSPGEMEEKIQD
jgi:hypothetical protein